MRVGLAQWYRAHPWGEQSGFDAQSWQPEMTMANIACKRQKSAGDDRSTLTLKLMSRVVRNRGYQWPHKNETSVQQKHFFKKKKTVYLWINKKLVVAWLDMLLLSKKDVIDSFAVNAQRLSAEAMQAKDRWGGTGRGKAHIPYNH